MCAGANARAVTEIKKRDVECELREVGMSTAGERLFMAFNKPGDNCVRVGMGKEVEMQRITVHRPCLALK